MTDSFAEIDHLLADAQAAARDARLRGEALPRLLRALGAEYAALDPHRRGLLWHLRGIAAWHLDRDIPGATEAFQRSIALLHGGDDRAYAGRVFDTLGQMLQHQGLLADARRELERALELKEASSDTEGIALTHGSLGRLCMELGDFEAAAGHLERDLAYVEEMSPDDARLRGQLLTEIGSCRLETGALDQARRLLEEALSEARGREDDVGQAFAAVSLARLELRERDLDRAESRVEEVRRLLARRAPSPLPELDALGRQLEAEVAWRRGDLESALVLFASADEAFALARRISPIEHAELLQTWASAYQEVGREREAAELLRRALRRLDATTAEALRTRLDRRLRSLDEGTWLLHSTGRFVGHGQIEFLLSEAGQAGFRGREEEVVILFSDLRRFTTVSERLAPEVLITVLNRYLGAMTRCVEHFGGMVDKFIGDAVMALFTLPTPRDDDSDRAVAAALFMLTELERFNRTLPDDLPPLAAGIGLHRGRVTAGLIGSPQKRSYTAIGDAVNTASRLESMTKQLAAPLLATSEVVDGLADRDRWLLLPLGRYRPKGRQGAIDVCAVLGANDRSGFAECAVRQISQTKDALGRLQAREYAAARVALRALAEAHRDGVGSRAYALLAAEAAILEETPPADEWDGVIVLTEK